MTERAGNRSRIPYYKLTDADLLQTTSAFLGPVNFTTEQGEIGLNPVIRTIAALGLVEDEQKKRRKSQTDLLRRLEKKGILSLDELVSGVTFRGRGKNRHAELNSSKITYLKEHGLAEAFEGYSFSRRSSVFKEAERKAKSKAIYLRNEAVPSGTDIIIRTSLPIQPLAADDKTDDDYDLRRDMLRRAIENGELGKALREAGIRPSTALAEAVNEVTKLDEEEELTQQESLAVAVPSPEAGDNVQEAAQEVVRPNLAGVVEIPVQELRKALTSEASQVESPTDRDLLTPPTAARLLRNSVYIAAVLAGLLVVGGTIIGGVGRPSGSKAQGGTPVPIETPTPQVSVSPTRTPVPGADTTNVETRIAYQLGTKEPNTSTPVPPTATFRVIATLPTGREFVATLTAPTPAELEPTALPTTTPSAAEIPSTQGQQSLMDSPEDEGGEDGTTGTAATEDKSLPTTGGESGIPKPVGIAGGLIAAGALWRKWGKLTTRRK